MINFTWLVVDEGSAQPNQAQREALQDLFTSTVKSTGSPPETVKVHFNDGEVRIRVSE